jgi:chemotaxis signal transduction protein/ABC-type nitrate/sulfonate/bicarbonate transport system substrate-binding protein
MALDQSITILLVEDSHFVRRSVVKGLVKLGFKNVLEAEDGNDAIAKLQAADNIDVIVSDWVMPNKDGYELLLWVRASEKFGQVPFIMATARGEKKQVTKATEAGVTDFITKPFGAPELSDLIGKVLSGEATPIAGAAAKPFTPRKGSSGKVLFRVAHIQITDHLALGVLKYLIATEVLQPQHFELETACMSSWNPVQQELEQGEVDAAFVLAPIAMDLFGYGAPIKLVLLAHKNGSILVRRKSENDEKSMTDFFRGKTFYIPHELSIHHMLSHMFLHGLGLNPGFEGRGDFDTYFEVVPPILMPEYLAQNPDAGGYLVAEPLGTKAIAEGIAESIFLSGELWENHPCCVVAMRDELVNQHPEAVQEFVSMLVQAGQFIAQKPDTAAAIGVPFLDPHKQLGLKESVLRDVLKEDGGIRTDDMFPEIDALEQLQQYMTNEVGVGSLINMQQFVDLRFAEVACKSLTPQQAVLHNISEIVDTVAGNRSVRRTSKASLNLEGKYLIFSLGEGEFGLNVTRVKEITDAMPITVVPHALSFVKGVVNLRGEIVPVIDLGQRLGAENGHDQDKGRIIVVEQLTEKGIGLVGIAVSAVSDVVDIDAKDIEEPSAMVQSAAADLTLGYAKSGDNIRLLLDTQRLLAHD